MGNFAQAHIKLRPEQAAVGPRCQCMKSRTLGMEIALLAVTCDEATRGANWRHHLVALPLPSRPSPQRIARLLAV